MLTSTLSQIAYSYHPETWNKKVYGEGTVANPRIKRRVSRKVPATHDSNHTSEQRPIPLRKRDVQLSDSWKLSQISTLPFQNWLTDKNIQEQSLVDGVEKTEYKYYFHSSQGVGQFIYIIEDGIWPDHPVK